MATILLLDAGVIGLAAVDPKKAEAAAFSVWIEAQRADPSCTLAVADVTWYEARRDFLKVGDVVRLNRIDEFCSSLRELRVTRDA